MPMDVDMCCPCDNGEIFWSVVMFIFIDVMYDLVLFKFPAEYLLCDPPVFMLSLSFHVTLRTRAA